MDRRTAHLLIGIMLLGVALTALPRAISFAQSDPFDGTWQLNVAKSEYNFGRPPKAESLNVQGEGQNRKAVGWIRCSRESVHMGVYVHS
jgi:hypothetical protein